MIPSFVLKPEHPRAVAMISEVDGVFVVEPMQFLWPSEAKRRAMRLAKRRKTVAGIQSAVATHYDIALEHMISSSRHWNVARPRQVAMYLVRDILGCSLTAIGNRFGHRDHTTVIHAIKAVEARLKHDVALANDIEDLREALE